MKRLVPNNPLLGISGYQKLFGYEERTELFDSWSHGKIMNALERRPDSSDFAPDLPVLMALGHTVGIKIYPIDASKLKNIKSVGYKNDIRNLRNLIRSEQRKLEKYRGTSNFEQREKDYREAAAKLQREYENILIKAKIADRKSLPKRKTQKFEDVPQAILEDVVGGVLGDD